MASGSATEITKTQSEGDFQAPQRHKKKLTKNTLRDWRFCAICLAYPVIQFVLVWSFVNIGGVLLAFKRYYAWGDWEWCGFFQFAKVIDDLLHSTVNQTGVSWLNSTRVELLNSFGYGFVTIFISLPLSLLFSYFLSKKMPLSNVFRVIFFLPNVIPIVALTLAFKLPFDSTYGYMYKVFTAFGLSGGIFESWPSSQIWIYIYCIWAGLGYYILLLSGAIGRIPKEIYESAEIDGAGYATELIKITVPLVWPTIITLVVLGMTNVLTLYLQPYLMTNGEASTYTIAMSIFVSTSSYNPVQYCEAAAKGLLFTIVWAPIVMLVRNLMSRCFRDVDY